MPRRLAAAAVTAAVLLAPAAAQADAIDGDWCAKDGARMMSIRGPAVVTPGGHRLTGEYERHFFRYQVPAGEPKAGGTVSMVLLNEDTVRLTDAADRWTAMQAGGEIWHRCAAPTSEAYTTGEAPPSTLMAATEPARNGAQRGPEPLSLEGWLGKVLWTCAHRPPIRGGVANSGRLETNPHEAPPSL
jgi:hypothetical protein